MRALGLFSLLWAAGLVACSEGDGPSGAFEGGALEVSARGDRSTLFAPGSLDGVVLYEIDASDGMPTAQLRLALVQQRSASGGPARLDVRAQQNALRASIGERYLHGGAFSVVDALGGQFDDLGPTEVELVTVALDLKAELVSAVLRLPAEGSELAIEGEIGVNCRVSSSEPPVSFAGEGGEDAPPRCAEVFDAIRGASVE